MRTILKSLFVIGLLIFCFILDYSTASTSEPLNINSAEAERSTISENTTESHLFELLIQPLNIVLGFVLGLFGTVFFDYLRTRRKTKEFSIGARTELKQILGMVNFYTLNPDAELNADKIHSFQTLIKDFKLIKILNPLGEETGTEGLSNRDLTENDIQQLVELRRNSIVQRRESDIIQRFRLLKCTYIKNNISSISLLPIEHQTQLMNILRRIDVINEIIPSIDFCFKKSYDTNVTSQNRERLKSVYQKNCQYISDWSFDTAKEIAHFIRLGAK